MTSPVRTMRHQPKSPLISIQIQKLTNSFPVVKGVMMLQIREYNHKSASSNLGLFQTQSITLRHKKISSMPVESNGSKLKQISYPIYPDGINYASVIFGHISIKTLLNLYYAMLLGEKVIIITEKSEIMALLVETIIKLMYPLDMSSYLVLGFICEEMLDYIHAPIPYIIG